MKIKVLEYKRMKGSHVKVCSHKKLKNGTWKKDPKYEFHKKQIELLLLHPIEFKKEYTIEKN